MKKFLLFLLMLPVVALADTPIITHTRTVQVALTGVDTSAYASGDLIDAKLTFSPAVRGNVGTALIQSVQVFDIDAQAADLKVVFFEADPSSTVFTDSGAFDVADADLDKIVCVVDVVSHHSFNDNAVSTADNVGCPFDLTAPSTSLYAAIVSQGTPTYSAATSLKIQVGFLLD